MAGFTEAVLFFKNNKVCKEMFYTEFEAVLDDVAGIPDFIDQELEAAFVTINRDLLVTGAVFFLVAFNSQGKIDPSWNVPLRHLLDNAGQGLDLGAGPIKLVCRSICPITWHKEQLWDPVLGDEGSFPALVQAVKKNRLGIATDSKGVGTATHSLPLEQEVEGEVVPISAAVSKAMEKAFDERLAALKSEEKFNIATQAEAFRHRTEALERKYTQMLKDREQHIAGLKARLNEAELQIEQLGGTSDQQQQLLEQRQAELESLLAGGETGQQQLELLKADYARQLEEQLSERTAELRQQLAQREQELFERSTQIVDIRAELRSLRDQNQQLLSSDNKLIQEMGDKGIIFIAYHPGVEHLVIPPSELQEYLENPTAYVAQRCEVSQEHYRLWLEHYNLPICRALNDDGEVCGQSIEKVLRPALFRPGESDRCKKHSESLITPG